MTPLLRAGGPQGLARQENIPSVCVCVCAQFKATKVQKLRSGAGVTLIPARMFTTMGKGGVRIVHAFRAVGDEQN